MLTEYSKYSQNVSDFYNDQPCFHYSLEWRYNLVLTLTVIEDDVVVVDAVVVDAAIVGVDDDEKPLLLHVPLLWLHWRTLLR